MRPGGWRSPVAGSLVPVSRADGRVDQFQLSSP